ncbi:MAG: DciA family protein [Planctomycetota bacterium]|jgi:predicted nucleic acid-binding Zn ribbon protein
MKQVKRPYRLNKAEKLGDVVTKFLEKQVLPKHARFSRLAESWAEILPSELAEHSYIEDISAGQLIVRVDAPSYKYELQLCSAEILQQLETRCSTAGIKRMKIIIG